MSRCMPREKPYDFRLEYKDDTNARIEPAEVRGHGRKGEGGASRIFE